MPPFRFMSQSEVRDRVLSLLHKLTGDAVILILRIYAMYNCNRTVLWTLSGLLFAQIVAQLVVNGPLVARLTGQSILTL